MVSVIIPKYLHYNTVIVNFNKIEMTLQDFINTNGIKVILNEILFKKVYDEFMQKWTGKVNFSFFLILRNTDKYMKSLCNKHCITLRFALII